MPRAGGPTPVGQVLIYPVIDPTFDTSSYQAYASGYVNTRAAMQWYWEQYLGVDVVALTGVSGGAGACYLA